jgi:hypothetical protein
MLYIIMTCSGPWGQSTWHDSRGLTLEIRLLITNWHSKLYELQCLDSSERNIPNSTLCRDSLGWILRQFGSKELFSSEWRRLERMGVVTNLLPLPCEVRIHHC